MWSPCFLLLLLPPVVLRRPTWSRIEPRWPDSNRMESFCYLRSVLRAKKPDLASTWWKVLESTLILLYFAIIWGIIITKSDGTCFVGRYLRLAMWHGDILFNAGQAQFAVIFFIPGRYCRDQKCSCSHFEWKFAKVYVGRSIPFQHMVWRFLCLSPSSAIRRGVSVWTPFGETSFLKARGNARTKGVCDW